MFCVALVVVDPGQCNYPQCDDDYYIITTLITGFFVEFLIFSPPRFAMIQSVHPLVQVRPNEHKLDENQIRRTEEETID